ncbi:hypothetical protein [Streptomyces wuyuanensis]|uniref:hypothetical protein n=1 Tax=Streptomyces wuyuanensis TaxID=1196353 RepID=UPI00343A5DED
MRSTLATFALTATGSLASLLTEVPWWIVIVMVAVPLVLLPVSAEARTWLQERQRRQLGDRIQREIEQLSEPVDRLRAYFQLVDRANALNQPPEEPPSPGEGPANSP